MSYVEIRYQKDPSQYLQSNELDVVIDGQDPIQVKWSVPSRLDLRPGQHSLHMSFPYLLRACGKADAVVDVHQNERYSITYIPPISPLKPGRISVESF
ncbi:hypothetical protein AGMMS49983_00360 [Clostridia bacterium]|nr:hypothetical protein AGMMS49983_00360 [Clostridia bacterium]